MTDQVRTRFAPSPTGHLHIGGVRTALFCWAYARGHGGTFMIRVEDTDASRSSEASAKGILEDLAWLGIEWDEGPEVGRFSESTVGRTEEVDSETRRTEEIDSEIRSTLGGDPRGVGPFFQSQRLEIYREHFERLLEMGRAYPAFETTEQLDAMRSAARERKETFRYRRPDDYDHAAATARMKTEEHVLRFHMTSEPVRVVDEVLGEIEFTDQHFDDFIIRKRNGFPTYHFAVVVDDELMGVTHVLRGQEHLNNTPRHVGLQKALGFRTPTYAHLPLIFNPTGSKMSKRDKDKAARAACKEAGLKTSPITSITDREFKGWLKDKKSQLETEQLVELAAHMSLELPEIDVDDFRRSGYLPEVVCNFVALLGWNPGMKNDDGTDLEKFDRDFLGEHFDFSRIGKSPSKFDRDKLMSFNQDALAAMSDDEFESAWRSWCERYEPSILERLGDSFALAARAAKLRAGTLKDAANAVRFALVEDDGYEFDAKAVRKVLLKNDGEGLDVLGGFREELGAIEPFEPEEIESAVRAFCDSRQIGMGTLAQPLRVAVTGSTVSPGLGETLALLGRERTIARIERCLKAEHAASGG